MNDSYPFEIDWYVQTYFYVFDINGIVKFGITSNWEERMKAYRREIGDLKLKFIKKEFYDERWKAELLEQIVKWRLRPWAFVGRHEWINAPIQIVLDCYIETRETITPEISNYEYIHRKGNDRWDFYKNIADILFV